MNAVDRLFAALAAAREAFGGKLTEVQWKAVVGEFLKKEFPNGKRRKTPANQLSDAEWIAELEADPAMEGINVKREIGRCQFHFKGKLKTISRARIKNWLLRAEKGFVKPMAGQSTGKQVVGDIYVEPTGWREILPKVYGPNVSASLRNQQWNDIGVDYRRAILEKML